MSLNVPKMLSKIKDQLWVNIKGREAGKSKFSKNFNADLNSAFYKMLVKILKDKINDS